MRRRDTELRRDSMESKCLEDWSFKCGSVLLRLHLQPVRQMKLYDTLIDLLAEMKDRDREILFIDGEKDESRVSFGELWERALALLGSMQARGMHAGDELIIFSKSNEDFVVAFWAAVLGGIVPVPVAVGISDEHKLKLFRILSQLDNPTLFTEMDLLQRLHDFAEEQGLAKITELLETHAVLMSDVTPGDHGEVCAAKPDDIGRIHALVGGQSGTGRQRPHPQRAQSAQP